MSDALMIERPEESASQTTGDAARDQYGFSPSMVAALSPGGAQGQAIRGLRTHIVAQHLSLGRRALAVCAPSLGVGCSFISANLAVSLSQIGVKTLLIDGDLRNGTLARMIRAPRPSVGLAQCLRSADLPFAAGIDADVLPNLSVMFAGESPANAQELLAGERFKHLMNFCLREYDATIVDSPPANTSSDARRISALVGYSLIVTARDKTMVKDVKVLIGQLKADHAMVVGTVLNRA
jgi:capsular exopolysaccharide synthesis family protein